VTKKILILADYKATENQNLLLSARNIPGVKLSLPHNLSVNIIKLAASLSDSGKVIASSYRPVAKVDKIVEHATKSASNPKSSGV
jgi:hypothetical protein